MTRGLRRLAIRTCSQVNVSRSLVGAVRLGLPHLTSLCGGLFAGREDADRHDDLGPIGFAWLVVTGQDWR